MAALDHQQGLRRTLPGRTAGQAGQEHGLDRLDVPAVIHSGWGCRAGGGRRYCGYDIAHRIKGGFAMVRSFFVREGGQGLVEYALIMVLIAFELSHLSLRALGCQHPGLDIK